MSIKTFAERKVYVLFALVLLILVLVGCGGTHPTSANNNLATHVASSPGAGSSTATATLKHQPVGNATLNWNPTSHMLSVQLALVGLAPNSIHPVHINQGNCSNSPVLTPGSTSGATPTTKALYFLQSATADAHGALNTTSAVSVPTGIPAEGWSLAIYNGPSLTTAAEALPIACGDVVNHNASLHSQQSVQTPLQAPLNAAGQNATGMAHLSLSGRTLTVQVTVTGLAPGTQHMVHIHTGTCTEQGAVVYTLAMLKADSQGKATSTTIISNVTTIPATGWYVNVHNSTDLSTQTGFDPVACGDVIAGGA